MADRGKPGDPSYPTPPAPVPLPPQPYPSEGSILFRAGSSSEIIAHEAKPESHPNDFYHSVTSK